MRAYIVDDEQIAHINLRYLPVDGKFVVVFTQSASDVVGGGGCSITATCDMDVVISTIHRRAQEVDSTGIYADKAFVCIFLMHGMGDKPAIRACGVSAQLGLDGDALMRHILEADIAVFFNTFADELNVRRFVFRFVRDATATSTYDITGALCENNDKFAIDRQMPEIYMGDLLIIHDVGAHGSAMGYQYNGRLRAAEVLYTSDGKFCLIRRAERVDDYFATITGLGLKEFQ